MAFGFSIDTSRQTYGVWKFGWIVDGSQPIQAWILPPPYVYIPATASVEDAPLQPHSPDAGALSRPHDG